MAYSLVQSASSGSASSGGTISATLGVAVTAGNCLIVAIAANTGTAPNLSGNSNTYTSAGTPVTNSGGRSLSLYVVASANGGTTTVSDTSDNSYGIYIAEYSGLTGTVVGYGGQAQTLSGTNGSDLVTSLTHSISSAPAMIWGFTFDTNTPAVANMAPAGTGFGNYTKATFSGGTTSFGAAEDQNQAATGSFAATFGSTNNNDFDSFITTMMAITTAAVSQAYLPYSTTQFFVTDQVIQF